ncbi:MAG: asparagine synthetase B family protein [Phormidesmis sp.]
MAIAQTQAAICAQPYGQQWVGYWGVGDTAGLSQRLQTLVKQHGGLWKIVDATDTLTLGLSASGIHHQKDAWVNAQRDRLTLEREAFGRVGLYWVQSEQAIWFASRWQWLLPLVKPAIDVSGLYGYSCFSYVPTPLTPVEQIAAIPAGTEKFWQFDEQGQLCSKDRDCTQWQQPFEQLDDEQEAIAQLQSLLMSSVSKRISDLSSDEPVGVLLSGGLDSSIVAALLVQAGMKVRAYTLDFGEYGVSELPYAQQVARSLGIPLTLVDASPKRIKQAMVPAIQALDLPFGDGVTVPLFLLSQAASQETRIVFNGEGGDQLFAGWTNKPLIAARLYQAEHPTREQPLIQQYMSTFHRLWGYEQQAFQPDTLAQVQKLRPEQWIEDALSSPTVSAFMHRMRRASVMLKGAQNIHLRATNLAFSQGLSVRSPFCDLPLARWTFRVSGELFLQGSCEKYILKRAVEDWLPAEIVWRRKRGMGVPMTPWCIGEWRRSLGSWLNPDRLQAEGHWQPDLAAKIAFGEFSGMIQGRRIGEILWLLIAWELWRSHVLKDPASQGVYRSLRHPFWLPNQLRRYRKWL